MGSTVTGVASSGRGRAKTDLRRRVVGLCLACRVGGWGTGGRLSPASVRGPSGGRGRCGHVHSLRTERDGAVSRRYDRRSGTTRSKASQRVGGDDTDTSLAGEGRRRNISPSAANDRARRDTGAGNSPDGRTCWDTHRVHPLTRTVESRDVRVGRGGAEARASSAFLFSASAFSSSGAQTLNPPGRGKIRYLRNLMHTLFAHTASPFRLVHPLVTHRFLTLSSSCHSRAHLVRC